MFVSMLCLSSAQAIVAYDNFGPGMSFDVSAGQGFGSQSDAEYGLSFTPIDSGYLSYLTVAVSSLSGEGEAIFTLYDDNLGEPGSVLETFNLSNLPAFGSTFTPQTITATGTTYLNSGQPYWLIASQPNYPDTGVWQNSTVAMDTLVAFRDNQFPEWWPQMHEQQWALRVETIEVPVTPGPVDLSGTIKTPGGTDICAMVLASGQYKFSCNPVGVFSFSDLPRDNNGTVKRQIYADGFFPKIDILNGTTEEAVVLTRSGPCPSYNPGYDPAVVPGSAGKRINISGNVLSQNSQTPICAMALANGQFNFSCDGSGSYSLNIPLDNNGQFKLQVYADGFAPTIQTFDEFQAINDVRMARAVECQ
jgi:hypothetical protein